MKMRTLGKVVAAGITLALVGAACSSNNDSGSSSSASGGGSNGTALTGAGATFPDPIYEQWFQDFQGVESGAQINYQAIGSGGGVRAVHGADGRLRCVGRTAADRRDLGASF